jgi:Ca2+/Na+ antiporter
LAPGTAEAPTLADLVDACKKRVETYADAESGFKGILLKKPRGFAKVRVRGINWQPRYFILDHHPTNPLRYSHADQATKFVTLPLQLVSHIERVGRDEIHISTPDEVYKLRLPAGEPSDTMQRWFDQIVVKIDELGYQAAPPSKLNGEDEHDEDHAHEHGPWWKMPDTGAFNQVVHVITFPIKLLVFTTTPNVLIKGNEKWFPLTIIIAMIWLAIFATLMTDVIEYLGCGISVDTTVMGLSLGAIGTSFPNLYASILVARAGQGGMSICQAIASNTFNICICLGLLWILQTLIGSCDYGHHGRSNEGPCNGCYAPDGLKPLCPYWLGTNNQFGSSSGSTKGAILVSLVWVAGFLITLIVGKNNVGKIPAYIMFAWYAIYIIYEFAAAFGDFALCFPSINTCI